MDECDFGEYLRAPDINLGISKQYQSRLISRCDRPEKRNSLWIDWIAPTLMIDELDMHLPLYPSKEAAFSHEGSKHAYGLTPEDLSTQMAYPLFGNALQVPVRYNDGKWQRPSERAAVAPFQIFTFEADETDLHVQMDWVWRKDENGLTSLDRLDKHLARSFQDYRGYCVVWSGNKSLHIHLIFVSSRLSRHVMEVMADAQGRNAEAQIRDHWQGDITPDMIWDYHTERWFKLEITLRSVTGITDRFDKNLRLLHQKRRLPWGLREAEKDNGFGFNEGDLIPQIVLEEHIRKTAAKGAQGYFLNASDANAMPPAQRSKHRSGGQSAELYLDELLPALTNYLHDGWGTEYPKPAMITQDSNGINVWFYNSPADQNPRSMVAQDYRAMVWSGRDTPPGEAHKPMPDPSLTMGELLVQLQDEIDHKNGLHTAQNRAYGHHRRRGPIFRLFSQHLLSTAPKHLRAAMSVLAWEVSQRHARNMIVSAEGGGKTTAAIRDAGRYRSDDMMSNFFGNSLIAPSHGFQVVAGASYKQAREHFDAYSEWWHARTNQASIDLPAPILLQSFSEHYKQYCASHDLTPIGYADALKQGYNSLVEAVFMLQPQAFTVISDIKNDAWVVPGMTGCKLNGYHNPTNVLIFTSHQMAHEFNQLSLSKAWLHPDFDPAMIQVPDAWRVLATEFQLYRLIHDEASLSDLVHMERASDVKTAKKFRKLVQSKAGQDWSKVNQSIRYQVFCDHRSEKMSKLGFHELCKIIDIGFTKDDVIAVDFHAHPFGINNSDDAMYGSAHGTQYYIKPRNWWMQQRARVLITTTEALVAQVASRINKQDDPQWIPQIRVHRLDDDAFISPDCIRLRRDRRASKEKINQLVQDRLSNGIDFVITDMADGSVTNLSSHISARGRNDLKDKHISSVLTFLAQDEFCRLNIIAQKFGISDVYQDHYRDRLNQAVGRNRGLRKNYTTPYDHEVIVSPTLYHCLGGVNFFGTGRYPAYLVL